jgi:type II secretory pathway component PulF
MTRLARLATIVMTFVTTMALSTTAALAYVPPQPPSKLGTQTIPAPTLVHTTSSSGVGAWTVLLIALGAVAVGIALDEMRRAIGRHHSHKLATA